MDKGEKDSIWRGVHENLEQATSRGEKFSSSSWKKRIVNQLKEYRDDLLESQNVLPPRQCNLPMFISLVKPKSVLDFGGSSGWVWDYINRSSIVNSVDEYVILENPVLVEYFNRTDLHQPPVRYTTEILTKNFDMMYLNSVLQYIYNDTELHTAIKQSNPKHILIEDFIGGDFEDFFTSQVYYDGFIPAKFRNRNQFLKSMSLLGYDLILQLPYLAAIRGTLAPLPVAALPKDKRVRYGETFLFARRDHEGV